MLLFFLELFLAEGVADGSALADFFANFACFALGDAVALGAAEAVAATEAVAVTLAFGEPVTEADALGV